MAALEHQPNCNRNHTDRQPCNRAGAATDVARDAPDFRPVVETPVILEAPRAMDATRHASDVAQDAGEIADAPPGSGEPSASGTATLEYDGGTPAPSPWAIRAWEDTAAAVGASASPAAPADNLREDTRDVSPPTSGLRHIRLIVGLAGATALAILVIKRRRKP